METSDDRWSLLESAPDGLLVATPEGVIVFANSQAVDMFGSTREQLVGAGIEDLLPEDLRAVHRKHRSQYGDHPTVRKMGVGLKLRARRLDDSEFAAEISLSPLTADDGTFVVAAVRDISDRLEAEEELRRNQLALAEAERMVLLVNDRERIARELHDTVIQRLFAAGLSLQATMRFADDAVRSRLERTIDDLDDTIRELRSAIFSLGVSSPTMGGLRGRILEAVGEIADPADVETRVQFDGPIETLDGQVAEHLVPIVREALSNAVRHGRAHTVRVSVVVSDEVVVTVADDGIGCSGEVLGGRGLINMTERATGLGGSASLRAGASGGSVLEWRVPRSGR